MNLTPIHDPAGGPLRAVALMSGSGTNIRRILEHGERLRRDEGRPLFEVAAIFSDRADSQAPAIGRDFDLPVLVHDLPGWLARHRVERRDLRRREQFDAENVKLLAPFGAKVAIYGGYMSIASPALIRAYIGVNVHPADLRVETTDGRRRFTGDHAVRDAIAANQPYIYSSTHLVTPEVDMGPLLLISAPVAVKLPAGVDLADPEALRTAAEHNQERLKEAGDWVVFPRTLEAIARGELARDEAGALYYRGAPIPKGLALETE
jgi:folate-dependent phosphoribosylglycinamide formyltransferase PurN